ncbi:MAG: hypothetical protein KAI47_21045, partial [Deltaproteobacteria bacterium]|nr:hypothetical protein [Deltaproteobacteria bacterium]
NAKIFLKENVDIIERIRLRVMDVVGLSAKEEGASSEADGGADGGKVATAPGDGVAKKAKAK